MKSNDSKTKVNCDLYQIFQHLKQSTEDIVGILTNKREWLFQQLIIYVYLKIQQPLQAKPQLDLKLVGREVLLGEITHFVHVVCSIRHLLILLHKS